ncbi:MAG: hypothetical protein MI863_01950 [Desulfobacterales bacterium]|nr:hypothetical protein [Desulfobacterales bacterium]
MPGLAELLMDIIKLTDSVKTLDSKTEKLSERTIDIDKRVVRLETFVEIGQGQQRQLSGKSETE